MINSKYIRTLFLSAAVAATGLCFNACDDDDKDLPGSGIETAQWSAINDADLKGQILIYEFEAPSSWTASSSEEWCHILTPNGPAGTSSLRIKVDPNDGILGRSADVTVKLAGYAEPCILTVRQGEGVVEKGDGRYRDINEWTYDILAKNYLWNDNIQDLILDYSIDYDRFLTSVLDGVAAIDDANHDDGFWQNGVRQMYYSNIQSNAPLSRSAGETYTGSGLYLQATILGENDDDPCGFAVMWVTPGSPADAAGVRRGDFISKVNNIAITPDNYQTLGSQTLNGNVTIDLNKVVFENSVATITNRVPSVLVGKDTYTDPAIYKSTVLEMSNGKKVGYILYMNFHMDYDNQLIDIFNQFKAAGVDELVIDLRYNNGGHVLSSTVLGTLVAGSAHQGQTYVRTTYNATRTAAGEEGVYKIGETTNPEVAGGYDKIPEALASSLNLNKVYVIGTINTASASELLINGLRGLDIQVNLIGMPTQGKNCGMEGWQKRSGNYTFIFYPITFYCENAKGFRDYADGFAPDLKINDEQIYPGDFGTMEDYMTNAAVTWAATGQKPTQLATKASRAGSGIKVLKSSADMNAPLNRRKGGSLTVPKNL